MTKHIEEIEIEGIKKLLLQRNTHNQIKNILDNLESSKEELILKELKELLHKGRSSILESEIRDIINKYAEEDEKSN